jgi:addiction module HigA family antidote
MKTKKSQLELLENGVLTVKMETKSKEYKDFRLLIKSKVLNSSKDERVKVALLSLKYEMEDYLKTRKSKTLIGKFIKQFILSTESKQTEFAEFLGMRPSNLSKLLNGERKLSLDIALILEKISNISAETWLLIQNRNEIFKLKKLKKKDLEKYKLKQLTK